MNEKKDISNHSEKVEKKNGTFSRRHFLKKAAYATPTIMALGHLTRPTNARADRSGAINNDPNLGTPKDFW
jgi:hypothetical protein